MRRVIHKIFWVWQLEKEQAWINEMASHGYSLEHAGRLTFEFEETEPDLYTYKSLFLKGWADSEENRKYMKFLEEMGIKVVCFINSTCVSRNTFAILKFYIENTTSLVFNVKTEFVNLAVFVFTSFI